MEEPPNRFVDYFLVSGVGSHLKPLTKGNLISFFENNLTNR